MSDDKPETPKKPAAKKPVARKPAASKPAASKPAAAKPAAAKPTAAKKPPATKPVPVVAAAATATPADTQPTEVLEPAAATPTSAAATSATEAAAASAPAATATGSETVVVDAPVKKRKKWPFVLGGILLLLAILLTIAFFVADALAKDYARDYIKERIVAVLGIDPATPVTVDIGEGSVLFQALAGRLDQVDVTAEEVTFGELTGSATVHAEGVPLDANAATRSLDVTFAIDESQVVAALGDDLSGIELQSVVLEEPEIVIATELDLFFFKLPIEMGLIPSAEEGAIVFTPNTITLAGDDFTPQELREQLGELADAFLRSQTMCVNESLPKALTITDVDVVAKDLVLQINGDGVALGGSDLSTMGTCEG